MPLVVAGFSPPLAEEEMELSTAPKTVLAVTPETSIRPTRGGVATSAAMPESTKQRHARGNGGRIKSHRRRSKRRQQRRQQQQQQQQSSILVSFDDEDDQVVDYSIMPSFQQQQPHYPNRTRDTSPSSPQVLLWHSRDASPGVTKDWSSGSSSPSSTVSSSLSKYEDYNDNSLDLKELDLDMDRQTPSPCSIFRRTSNGKEPVDLLSKGPQWYQLEYWRRLVTQQCCKPKRETSTREADIDFAYQRSSQAYGAKQAHYPVQLSMNQQLNPYYFPQQMSTMANHHNQQQFPGYSPWPTWQPPPQHAHAFGQAAPAPAYYQQQQQQQQTFYASHAYSYAQSLTQDQNNEHSGYQPSQQPAPPRRSTWAGAPSARPDGLSPPRTEPVLSNPIMDNRPMTSNNNYNSGNIPSQHNRNRTMSSFTDMSDSLANIDQEDDQSLSSLESSIGTSWNATMQAQHSHSTIITNGSIVRRNSSFSNRLHGLRQRRPPSSCSGASSAAGNKPPVPPRRRAHTDDIRTSSAKPPVAAKTPTHLSRSFSNMSTGSRHRRGGTVAEFSFIGGVNNLAHKPTTRKQRCSSLPLEVQIQVHYATPELPPPNPRPAPATSMDKGVDESTPEGYISPLEEEQYDFRRQQARASPSEAPGCDDSQHNPQDSLLATCPTKSFEDNTSSPFAKLKEPPSIPSSEAWMWDWVNSSTAKSPPTVASPLAKKKPPLAPATVASPPAPEVKQEYMPKNDQLEQEWREQHGGGDKCPSIVLSGWLAFGKGKTLTDKLRQNQTLEPSDLSFVVAASNVLWYKATNAASFNYLDMTNCRVQVQELSLEHGRAVSVVDSKGGAVGTLLPVCLPCDYSSSNYEHLDCFPKNEYDYLPDDQQYTTMHIMFALDALLKSTQRL